MELRPSLLPLSILALAGTLFLTVPGLPAHSTKPPSISAVVDEVGGMGETAGVAASRSRRLLQVLAVAVLLGGLVTLLGTTPAPGDADCRDAAPTWPRREPLRPGSEADGFVEHAGSVSGPYRTGTPRSIARCGSIAPTAPVRQRGSSRWQHLREVLEPATCEARDPGASRSV